MVADVSSTLDQIENDAMPRDDAAELAAKEAVLAYFLKNPEEVFFSRQIEVLFEHDYFHWITNRAIRDLIAEGKIMAEWRKLQGLGGIHLLWNKGFRYYKRKASEVVALVAEYSNPIVTESVGSHGETMALTGFAEIEFVLKGRESKSFGEKTWNETNHNVDFIFARDQLTYGVEVKNTLGYMQKDELDVKVALCLHLEIAPVFVVRMMPKTWIKEVIDAGGFVLVMGYQMYHLAHRALAKRVRERFGLPVDAPKRLQNQTMQRFLRWHQRRI